MTIVVMKIIYILILMFFVSYFTGRILAGKEERIFAMPVVTGLTMLMGIFFVICLPMIILKKTLTLVMQIYIPICLILTLAGIVITIVGYARDKAKDGASKENKGISRESILYLGIFIGVVAFQLYKAAFYAVSDGDDAFYVAVAENSRVSDTMYLSDPYTGFVTNIPYRYAFAPFPVFLALISRVAMLPAGVTAHIAMPLFLIPVTYIIFNGVGVKLFGEEKEKRYMFLALISIFAMFGNYSINTAETFMLTRARQGKEALAAVMLPYAFYMFFVIAKGGLKKFGNVLIIAFLALAAALCSVFGNIIMAIVFAFYFLYLLLKKASAKEIIWAFLLCGPNVCLALLYFIIS